MRDSKARSARRGSTRRDCTSSTRWLSLSLAFALAARSAASLSAKSDICVLPQQALGPPSRSRRCVGSCPPPGCLLPVCSMRHGLARMHPPVQLGSLARRFSSPGATLARREEEEREREGENRTLRCRCRAQTKQAAPQAKGGGRGEGKRVRRGAPNSAPPPATPTRPVPAARSLLSLSLHDDDRALELVAVLGTRPRLAH